MPPRSPRTVDPDVPEDVGWIALRALEKEPERRYPSASELAADVRRFLGHRPVEASPPSRAHMLRKFVRRNRLAVGATLAVSAALVAAGGVAIVAGLRTRVEADKFRSISAVLDELLASASLEERGRDARVVDLIDDASRGLEHVAHRPEVEAALRSTLTRSYRSLGFGERAVAEGRRALELGHALSADERCGVAYQVGMALIGQGRLDEARAILADRADDLVSARATQRLAARHLELKLLEYQRGAAGVIDELRELVGNAQRELGADDPQALDYQSTLLVALIGRSELDEALELARDLVGKRERSHGPLGPDALTARANLALVLGHRNQHEAAIAEYERLMPSITSVFGAEHSHALTARRMLASLYISKGEPARALPLLEQLVRTHEARVGPEHADTLAARKQLGVALADIESPEAEGVLRATLETHRRIDGENHRATLEAQFELGRFLRRANRLSEAEEVLADLCARGDQVWVDDDLERHRHRGDYGAVLWQLGRHQEAADVRRRVWLGFRRLLGEGDERTLTHANNYAVSLLQLERWDESIEVLESTLAAARRGAAGDPSRRVTVLTNLAVAHLQRGERIRAEELFREALDKAESELPGYHAATLSTREKIGYFLVGEGRADEALPIYRRLMEGVERSGDLSSKRRSEFWLGFARCLGAANRVDEALHEMRALLEAERARLSADHADWFASLEAEIADLERRAARVD